MQRHTCYVVVENRPHLTNKNALLYLEQVTVTFPSYYCEIFPCHRSCSTAVRFHVLEGCKHLESTQRLARTSRDVRVFLQTFFPIPLCRAYVTEVALSASVLVNYTRHQGFGKFVFKGEARWQSPLSLVNDFQVGKGNNFSKTADHAVFHIPRCGTQKWQNHQEFLLRSSVNSNPLLVHFVEKTENTFINKIRRVAIFSKNSFQILNFIVHGFEWRADHVCAIQKCWDQTPLVYVRHEWSEVRVYSRKSIFSVNSWRKLITFTVHIDVEKGKWVVYFYFIGKLNVRMPWREIISKVTNMFLWPDENENIIHVTNEEDRCIWQWAFIEPRRFMVA